MSAYTKRLAAISAWSSRLPGARVTQEQVRQAIAERPLPPPTQVEVRGVKFPFVPVAR